MSEANRKMWWMFKTSSTSGQFIAELACLIYNTIVYSAHRVERNETQLDLDCLLQVVNDNVIM